MKYMIPLLAMLTTACNIDETEIQKIPSADFATIIEYTPAPGQFINDQKLAGFGDETTAEAACAYATRRLRAKEFVSLGGWGGYIVAGFTTPIENDGNYNLLIEGNSMSTSSEPGIVWVMEDTNGNDQPDDTWYELKGSEQAKAMRNYEVTYRRPANGGDPVAWSDNIGGSGTIDRTVEHPQTYYPAWITTETHTLRGTLLPDNIALIDKLWVAQPFEGGYVDNYSKQGRNLFRISDAMDAAGNAVALLRINFVKIQSGVNAQAPLIGEVSTEVCSIRNYNLLK